MPLSPVHFRRNFFIVASSASKITVGIALPATFSLSGFLEIMNLTLIPLPYIASLPRNSASLFAQVIEVDLRAPYSSKVLLMTLDSAIYSMRSDWST